ncbi:hypothetical protein B0J11DRAFT_575420 [Dendryphion nanum]|uniref:Kinesin light chain n=1 Tax=Dendryphion nanum TaxID=256645 RepID=A0A9P9EM61_9PLEO|nr:hypothetical protein B0J11DRAFT_575420 [Dendryphion nanum]
MHLTEAAHKDTPTSSQIIFANQNEEILSKRFQLEADCNTTFTSLTYAALHSASPIEQEKILRGENIPETFEMTIPLTNLPPRPRIAPGNREAECPYCFTVCSADEFDEISWPHHIIQDLMPFVCVLPECPSPNAMYDTHTGWISHMRKEHTHRGWACMDSTHIGPLYFSEKLDFKTHIETEHGDDFSEDEVENIIEDCYGDIPGDKKLEICPFCGERESQYWPEGNIEDHIARRLISLAHTSISWHIDLLDNVLFEAVPVIEVDRSTFHIVSTGQSAATSPLKLIKKVPFILPLERPTSFAGRLRELNQLQTHVLSEGGKKLAVYGLGGCGKTALVLELAYWMKKKDPSRTVFWVPAFSQESFEQAYRDMAQYLEIPGIEDSEADVKELVKSRLSKHNTEQWLLIVDNVDDSDILFSPLGQNSSTNRLIDYLPHSSQGSIVFTSRTRKTAVKLAPENLIALGDLTKHDAIKMLKARLHPEHQHELLVQETIDTFLDTLNYFALAIVQAAAFINRTGISLSMYVSMYRNSEKDATTLLHEVFDDQSRYQDHNKPVATTWYTSFEQIRREDNLASQYLSFMACTLNTDIPASMLPGSNSSMEHTNAIETLKAYTFITERIAQKDKQQMKKKASTKAFDMHPLVQIAIKGWLLSRNKWNSWIKRSLKQLKSIVPRGDHETRRLWMAYLPHAVHLVRLEEANGMKRTISLLERIGHCECALGRYLDAEQTHQCVLDKRKARFGEEHPATLASMNDVGLALSLQGKHAMAETFHRETLFKRRTVLGDQHVSTLISMNNLADTLHSRGKYTDSERMHRDALALEEILLGERHMKTLSSMSNLAKVLGSQGRYTEAEAMNQKTLVLMTEVLGEKHPTTLTSMNNVGDALRNLGRYHEAEAMHQKTLVLMKDVHGEKHPKTLTSMNNVGLALGNLGKYREAERIHRETLLLRKEVHGTKHPETLISMNNLGTVLGYLRRYKEAESIQKENLALMQEVHGLKHPSTFFTMHNLAITLGNVGKNPEALSLMQDCVILREQVCGYHHPNSTSSRRELSIMWKSSVPLKGMRISDEENESEGPIRSESEGSIRSEFEGSIRSEFEGSVRSEFEGSVRSEF